MAFEEKRKFPRLSLKIEDGYFGTFRLLNQDNFAAPIMNLSAGGLNMAVTEQAKGKIKEGDRLMLQRIDGGTSLAFLSDIQAEVRWIKSVNFPGYVFVGCKFKEVPDQVRQQLSKFVHTERMTRGQYD